MQTNPVKAIRDWCFECSGRSTKAVNECSVFDCPLYPFRRGKNPFRTPRKLTDEQREAAAKNLASARKNLTRNQERTEQNDSGKENAND